MTRAWNLSRCCLFCVAILLFAAGNSTWAETISREAQKHMNRGMAATEMAKSPADYEEAIREFEQAVSLAPGWPAPYFNLGCVQKEAGKYQEALSNYRKYLELVPNAPDAEQVQIEIDQIEYKLEKASEAAKIRSWLKGEWMMFPVMGGTSIWPVTFIVKDDSAYVYMPTARHYAATEKDQDRLTDHETISIKQQGRKIQFSVVFKEAIPEGGSLGLFRKGNAQYEFNLIDPVASDRIEGTLVITIKDYNSNGSLESERKQTKEASMIKQKHSDTFHADTFLRILRR